ncbi:MAG: glycosyltransferase [Candidatus Lernaella stagnicola]|nr:glycosyltransferase [Candidatus Lernaella stagnicola]
MKIGMVSREYPPFFGGGVGTYVYQMSRAFAEAGHEVHVFTVRTGTDDRHADPPGVTVHREPFEPTEIQHAGFQGSWTAAQAWFQVASLFRGALLEWAADHELDVVEFPEWEAPGWMLALDWQWTVPMVVNSHTPTWVLQELNGQPPLPGALLEKLQLALADGVCAPCSPMAVRVEAGVALAAPVTVVHHPFFADGVLDEAAPPTGRRMLYVGRLERRKGVITLVDAAQRALGEFADAELVLVGGDTTTRPGGGSMKEYLCERIDARFRSRIHFVENIPPAELYEYYRAALFCVFPSIFENFPNVCLEAMAAGRTAIVGRDSGMVEMIGEAGVPVAPEDPDSLATEMIALLGDPERAATLGRRAFDRVRDVFAPEKMAARRVAFYQSIIDQVGARSSLQKRLARVALPVWREVMPEYAAAFRVLLEGCADEDESASPADRVLRKVRAHAPWPERPLRAALYGGGQHTRKLAPYFGRLAERGLEIALILDDDPRRAGQDIAGVKIAPPSAAIEQGVDIVVLSSDAAEPMLWEKSRPLRAAGLPVVRLYAPDD